MISLAALTALLFSMEPAVPELTAIFGPDDRRDAYEVWHDELARRTIGASAVMIYGENLPYDGGTRRYSVRARTHGERHGLCADERFVEQPAPGLCSGFLVASDLIVTAGHCMQWDYDCDNNYWVFGYAMKSRDQARVSFPERDVYRCRQVLAQVYDPDDAREDYAIVLLDRPVEYRSPLPLRRTGSIATGAPVALAGYPGGVPVKWVGSGSVTGSDHPNTFYASLDAVGGNSGSPVVNRESGEVEGVLINGGGYGEYAADPVHGCQRPLRYSAEPRGGVEIQRVSVLLEQIRSATNRRSVGTGHSD